MQPKSCSRVGRTANVVFLSSSGATKFVFWISRVAADAVFRHSSIAAKILAVPAFGGPNFLVYIYIYIIYTHTYLLIELPAGSFRTWLL